MIPTDFGGRVAALRAAKGVRQDQLADLVGTANSTISRYEEGKLSDPKDSLVEAVAKALEVNPAYLRGADAELVDLPPERVAARESLRIFIEQVNPEADEVKGFELLRDLAVAPRSVQDWQRFREMVRGYLGLPPPERAPIPLRRPLLLKKQMLRVATLPVERTRGGRALRFEKERRSA